MSNENNINNVPEDGGENPSACSNTEVVRVSDVTPKLKRVELTNEQLDEISHEELRTYWKQQDSYINSLESLNNIYEGRHLVHFVIYCAIFIRQVISDHVCTQTDFERNYKHFFKLEG